MQRRLAILLIENTRAAGCSKAAAAKAESAGVPSTATCSVPYPAAQVKNGAAVYKKQGLSNNGARLQGVAALGSLSKSDDAAVMAYILGYVKSTGGSKPSPVTLPSQVANVRVGGATCPI